MKKLVILFLLMLLNSSFAQLSINVSSGFDLNDISLSKNTPIDGNNAYWKNGISIGGNIEYSISEQILISTVFHYSHYNFDKFINDGFTIPEITFLYAEGEDTEFWRVSVEAKYFPSSQNRFNFFILSGLGVVVENLGTIKTHYKDMNEIGIKTYIIDSEIKNNFVHSLGLGIRTKIISSLYIDITGSYYSNYDDRFQTFFGLSVGYKIF